MFGLGLWLTLAVGSKLKQSQVSTPPQQVTSTTVAPPDSGSTERSPLAILLVQMIVIIVLAKLFGSISRTLGQPPVMGEMVAGITLGPSVLGLLSPALSGLLFPVSSLGTLSVLSQLGVVLFMFIVGMELDLEHLRERASAALMVSHASIVFPFLLGSMLALFLYQSLAPPGTTFTAFGLFMGIAMSITAFPVLARILTDRGLAKTPLGISALTCASIDDATAWCILAFVIAIVKATGMTDVVITVGLTILFIVLMLFLIRPLMAHLTNRLVDNPKRHRLMMAAVLAFALACAWFTEMIGIHALFGGFLAGVVMPSNQRVQSFFKNRVEPFCSAALLPLFFVFTGLRTQISLLNDWNGWLMCLAIICVAIVGKLGGSMLMARWTKMSWRDSYSLGVLMNTRGLIELVILNIGYDLGILSARIFVMMVIMALTTTFMTAPLLSLTEQRRNA